MGLFWELFQELQINKRKVQAGSLEERVAVIEQELLLTQDILSQTLNQLEQISGVDFPSIDTPV